MVGACAKRQVVDHLVEAHEMPQRHACELLTVVRSTIQYQPMLLVDEAKLIEAIHDLAEQRRIVDFKVRTWAEPLLVLRVALYEDQTGKKKENRFNSGNSGKVSFLVPTGHRRDVKRYLRVVSFG